MDTHKLISLEQALGYHFQDSALLKCALTHRSFGAAHNERLEFLGDAVLDLCIAHLLYQKLQRQAEGELSRIRANLVKQDTLHQLALQLGLPALLRLSDGELKSGGANRPSILADALEAIIGAVYLDGGLDPALTLINRLFENIQMAPQQADKDAKTKLQEILQGQGLALPQYKISEISGAAHQQKFTVTCYILKPNLSTQGHGLSRRSAEQDAAKKLVAVLNTKTAQHR